MSSASSPAASKNRGRAAAAAPAPEQKAPAASHALLWRVVTNAVWITAVLLALTFVGVDSMQRFKGITLTSSEMVANQLFTNIPWPAKDPNSMTGYYGNSHVTVMPALGTDGYHWIMQTERMLSGAEGVRVRHVDYDGVDTFTGQSVGRDVHWSSSLHWIVTFWGWLDHMITGVPMVTAIERDMSWANTSVLVALILFLPALVVRRFGWCASALLAMCFVCLYPYYEFSFVGYFDHHGLAASSDLLMVLFLAGSGAGWLRDPNAKMDKLPAATQALWAWLPERTQARRWIIASAIAGGTGLWISTASVIPAMFGIGVAALLSTGFLARTVDKKSFWIVDPTLWRVWGTAGALTSLFYYALEYLPFHFSWRLEVNHPFYAIAWYGAGDILCRLSWLIQGEAAGANKTTFAKQARGLTISALLVALIPITILIFGETVFRIRFGSFLINLHQDYILEFRSFLKQMSFLTAPQVVGGISVIPLVCLPMTLLLFNSEVPRPVKAVLLTALGPALVMLLAALVQIRWLGIDCAVCAAGLAVTTMAIRFMYSWPPLPWYQVLFIAGIALAWVAIPVLFMVLAPLGQIYLLLAAAAVCAIGLIVTTFTSQFNWPSLPWDKAVTVFGVTTTCTLISIYCLLDLHWGQDFLTNYVYIKLSDMLTPNTLQSITQVSLGITKIVLLIVLPAFVLGLIGIFFFQWKGRETSRAVFTGLFGFFILATVVTFPSMSIMQWTMSHWSASITDLDLTQIVTRDVSYRLRLRLGDERGVILSGPTTTTWMMYFGGFRGLGTLYWENVDGLEAAASIYSAPSADAAYKLIQKYGVTHLVIYQWDAFAMEYSRLARGIRYDPEHPYDAPQDAFILQLITHFQIPTWLRPLPYHVPNIPRLSNNFVFIFEVDRTQTLEEAQVHVAQWMASLNSPTALQQAESRLNQILAYKPDYLQALVALALLQQGNNQADDAAATLKTIALHLDQADALVFEDRVDLALALFQGGDAVNSAKQFDACVAQASEQNIRRLGVERIINFLQLMPHLYGKRAAMPPAFDIGLKLLAPAQQAQVLAEEGAVAAELHQMPRAVDLFQQSLKLVPDYDAAAIRLARILCCASDASVRDGKQAQSLALDIFTKSATQNTENLDLLACADAETGNFDDAVFYETQALQLATNGKNSPAMLAELQSRLQLFTNHQAYHQL